MGKPPAKVNARTPAVRSRGARSGVVSEVRPPEHVAEQIAEYRRRTEIVKTAAAHASDAHVEQLAQAIGEQGALVLDAMDRWFDYLLERLDVAAVPAIAMAPEVSGPQADKTPAASLKANEEPELDEGRLIERFDLKEGWRGWGHHQAVRMLAGGEVELRQGRSTPGVVSPTLAIDGGAVIRLTVNRRLGDAGASVQCFARIVDDRNVALGPDFPLAGESQQIAVFAPVKTRKLKIYLLVSQPVEGSRFGLDSVAIERFDVDAWRARSAAGAPAALASLASIPQRREMLEDCVLSLLAQCDRVRVFLNGYSDVPAYLRRERVDVRRSQSFDDRGDAGKFAWIDADDPPGYRVIVDDDLVFPPDFVGRMTAALARYGDMAIVGAHGVLLKQPVSRYYDGKARTAFHFESALPGDRAVHILGTNSICFHSAAAPMRSTDFMWPNMADIFLARYAQQAGLPMITISRPAHWVRQSVGEAAIDTIYEHSLKQTGTRFDTSWIQDALIKDGQPWSLRRPDRIKAAAILVVDAAEAAEATFAAWRSSCSFEVEWVILVVDPSADGTIAAWFAEFHFGFEAHIVAAPGGGRAASLRAALAAFERLQADVAVVIEGCIRFSDRGWLPRAHKLLRGKPWLALVLRSPARREIRRAPSAPRATLAVFSRQRFLTLASLSETSADPIADLLGKLGDKSEQEGNDALETLAAIVAAKIDETDGTLATPEAYLAKADAVLRPSLHAIAPPALTINDYFDDVLVINLDRRPDRWREVSRRLAAARVEARRVAAIDGRDPEVAAEHQLYLAQARVEAPDARQVISSYQFYAGYQSQLARTAFQEARIGGKAIRTAGAWAYLKTWRRILERALRERRRRLLVFDDDVVLHKQTQSLFTAVAGAAPEDWMILQLGSMQHHWEPPWLRWRGPMLYSTCGCAVGSHAVGLSREILPYLLDQVDRMLLPFDIGSLSAAVRAFSDRCYVVAPNIAIQALDDSDIETSEFLQRDSAAEIYRWRRADYDFGAVRERAGLPMAVPALRKTVK